MASNEKTTVKNENKKEELKKTNAVNQKTSAEALEDAIDEDGNIDTDKLFKYRESIDLTPDNAWFTPSEGGLISLRIINAEGVEETFERVVLRRSFPISAPDEFLSVREPDTKLKGRGSEIGMIRNIHIFDKETVALLNAELDLRYFTPTITRIISAKEKFGYNYWEAETTAGSQQPLQQHPFPGRRQNLHRRYGRQLLHHSRSQEA